MVRSIYLATRQTRPSRPRYRLAERRRRRCSKSQRSVRDELAGQLSFFSHDMTQQIHASVAQLSARLENLQCSRQKRNRAAEDRNRLIHLDTSVHSRFNEVLNEHLPVDSAATARERWHFNSRL